MRLGQDGETLIEKAERACRELKMLISRGLPQVLVDEAADLVYTYQRILDAASRDVDPGVLIRINTETCRVEVLRRPFGAPSASIRIVRGPVVLPPLPPVATPLPMPGGVVGPPAAPPVGMFPVAPRLQIPTGTPVPRPTLPGRRPSARAVDVPSGYYPVGPVGPGPAPPGPPIYPPVATPPAARPPVPTRIPLPPPAPAGPGPFESPPTFFPVPPVGVEPAAVPSVDWRTQGCPSGRVRMFRGGACVLPGLVSAGLAPGPAPAAVPVTGTGGLYGIGRRR